MRRLACLLALVLLVAAHDAQAQSWPARPIKFIVSQAAGGTPDIICRLITDRLSRALAQQVVVENRPGGGNVIGAQAAARSAPDGYTFFFATAAALVTNPYTFKSLPYDPAHDFAPVSMVASNPFFLLAHPSVTAKTLSELIARDKAEPGKLTAQPTDSATSPECSSPGSTSARARASSRCRMPPYRKARRMRSRAASS